VRLRAACFAACLATTAWAQEADFIRVRQPESLPAPLAAVLEQVDAARIARHLTFLTDPRQDGRGLGTPGLARTVQFLAEQLKVAGVPPLGSSYVQTVPLREVRPGKSQLLLRTASRSFSFDSGRNAVFPAMAPGRLSGPVVFAGFGIQEPALGHDDFRGLDLRGKVVVFRDGLPSGPAWNTPEMREKYASPRPADRYDARLALFEKLGAKAAIALEEGLDQRLAAGKEPALPYFLGAPGLPGSGEPPLIRVTLTPDLGALVSSGEAGWMDLHLRGEVRSLQGQNLLGQWLGSDPTLQKEAILIGAHMDHLGRPGGILHPGADDNASGVSALLEILRVLAASPVSPRRTILFAFWTGEEEGKFGSGHYTRHPRWPLAATKVYLNLDMIGHPWTPADLQTLVDETKTPATFLEGLDPAAFAEPGLASGHRDLGPVLVQAGRGTGMSLHLDWTDGRQGGSDYRDFARLDVPFVRFFGSYFPEYHQPGDTADKLDPGQVKRMARLVLATAWLLADR
jgi:hypothetical protein